MLPVVLSLLVLLSGSLALPREMAGEFPSEGCLNQINENLPREMAGEFPSEGYLNQITDDSDDNLPSHAILTTYADGSPIPGLAESYLNASDPSSYIVGGKNAEKDAFPYMASIQVQVKGKAYHVCGGFLSPDPNVVVTAAHCIAYIRNKPTMIALGAYQLSLGNSNPGYQWVHPYRYTTMPKWTERPWGRPFDLMVLRMKEPVKITKYVKGIGILKKSPSSVYGKEAIIAGWGQQNAGYARRDILREAKLEIISFAECQVSWPDDELDSDEQHVCALAKDRKQGPCKFDGGSPLVVNNEVVGVASIWDPHCYTDVPSIYNVPFYHINWLRKVLYGN